MIPGLTAADEEALNAAFDGPAEDASSADANDQEFDDGQAIDQETSGDDGADADGFSDDGSLDDAEDDQSPGRSQATPAPASARANGELSPELTAAEQRAQAAEAQLEKVGAWFANAQAAAAQAEADRQYNQFMASLEDMDPEDAANAKMALVAEFAANVVRERDTEKHRDQEQRNFEVAFNASFDYISAGNRLRPDAYGRLVPAPNSAPPLNDHEKELLRFVKGSAAEMQDAADRMVAARQQKTAAARRALAEKRRQQGEGTGTGNGVRTGVAAKDAPKTIDEYWAQHDARFAPLPVGRR